jgi:peroxiredoxin
VKARIPIFTPVRTVFRRLCIAAIFALWVGSTTEVMIHAQKAPQSSPSNTSRNLIGRQAPAFTVATLDGAQVSLADYRGKAVLVNFWATWCGACKVEIPWLVQLREKYAAQGFEVLGILTNNATPEKIASIKEKYGIKYPILMCNHATAQAYGGLPELPASFFVDRSGKVVAEMGSADSLDEIEVNVRKALGGGRP